MGKPRHGNEELWVRNHLSPHERAEEEANTLLERIDTGERDQEDTDHYEIGGEG